MAVEATAGQEEGSGGGNTVEGEVRISDGGV